MSSVYKPPQGKGTLTAGTLFGIIVSLLIFLAIPLTQIFIEYEKSPEEIDALEMAPPPPPPPPEDPPPPPEPEEEEPPPELDSPPPPLSLDMLDLALGPGTGNSLAGDFALPSFDIGAKDLGGLDIFDINAVDTKPQPRKQASPNYPIAAKRQKLEGYALAEFVIDENGNVINIQIKQSSNPIFEKPTIDAIRSWKFTPGEKDGRKVKTRTRIKIPYNFG